MGGKYIPSPSGGHRAAPAKRAPLKVDMQLRQERGQPPPAITLPKVAWLEKRLPYWDDPPGGSAFGPWCGFCGWDVGAPPANG